MKSQRRATVIILYENDVYELYKVNAVETLNCILRRLEGVKKVSINYGKP